MVIRCFVCKNNQETKRTLRNDGFPKNKDLKKQWLDFFKLTEDEVFVSSRVCSDHFVENDFIDNRQGGGLRVLKQGSKPSIRKKHIAKRLRKRSKKLQNQLSSIQPKNEEASSSNWSENVSPMEIPTVGFCGTVPVSENVIADSITQDECETSIKFEACNPIIKTELSSEIDVNEDVKYNITSEDLSAIKEDPLSLFDLSIVKEEKEVQSHDLPTDKEEASSYDLANVKTEVSSSTTPELIQIRHLESQLDEREKNIKALKEIISRLRKDNATLKSRMKEVELKNEKLEKEVKALRKTPKKKM